MPIEDGDSRCSPSSALILLPQVRSGAARISSRSTRTIFPLVLGSSRCPKPPTEAVAEAGQPSFAQQRLRSHAAPKNLVDPTHELDHFYAALLKGGTTRILHYGDSPTTGDLITADARAHAPETVRRRRQGLRADRAAVGLVQPSRRGDGCVELEDRCRRRHADRRTACTAWAARAFAVPPGAVRALDSLKDAQQHRRDRLSGAARRRRRSPWRPTATSSATVETAAESRKPRVRVFRHSCRLEEIHRAGDPRLGAALRRGFRKDAPGVVYSSLGINGANVTLLSRSFNGPHWAAELRHYKPDLVIINYGTNESGYPKFVDGTWGAEMKEAVRRRAGRAARTPPCC